MLLRKTAISMMCIVAVFLFLAEISCYAEPASNSVLVPAEPESVLPGMPEKMLYPEWLRASDYITWHNVKRALYYKFRFLRGRRPTTPEVVCHKFQRRISRAVDRYVTKGFPLPFSEINDYVLFSPESSIDQILSPRPKLIMRSCSYHSYGDIKKGCVMYCDIHGVDHESEFYHEHRKELEASKPFLTSEDVAEMILFLPSLIILFIAVYMVKKARARTVGAC